MEPATLMEISEGEQGTRDTLRIMARLVRDGKKSLYVRSRAASLVDKLKQKDWRGEAAALHQFVRDHIRYVRDIRGVETVQEPEYTLLHGYGDCDDKSTLLAAMLESIGHPTRLVAVAKTGRNYCHVLVETKIGGRWIPAETTEPVGLGWFPNGVSARMVIYT